VTKHARKYHQQAAIRSTAKGNRAAIKLHRQACNKAVSIHTSTRCLNWRAKRQKAQNDTDNQIHCGSTTAWGPTTISWAVQQGRGADQGKNKQFPSELFAVGLVGTLLISGLQQYRTIIV